MNLDFRVFNNKTKQYSSFINLNKNICGNICYNQLNDDDEIIHEPYTQLNDFKGNKIYFWDILKSKDNKFYYVDCDYSVASFCLIEHNGDVDEHLWLSSANIDFFELVIVGRKDGDKIIYNEPEK